MISQEALERGHYPTPSDYTVQLKFRVWTIIKFQLKVYLLLLFIYYWICHKIFDFIYGSFFILLGWRELNYSLHKCKDITVFITVKDSGINNKC